MAKLHFLALYVSLGTYIAAWRMKRRTRQAHDQVAMLRSIPDVPIGVASAMLPDPDTKRLVWLRGVILPLSSVDNLGDAESPSETTDNNKALVSNNTADLEAVVIVDRTWHIYKRKAARMIRMIRGTLSKTRNTKLISTSLKQVPFIIGKQLSKPCNEYVFVNWDGKEELVPLEQVSCSRKELNLLQIDSELTVEEVREEKAISQGTVVTALGLLSSHKGIPTIEPSKEHPFFVITKSKEQMIEELSKDIGTTSRKAQLYSCLTVGLVCFHTGGFLEHLGF